MPRLTSILLLCGHSGIAPKFIPDRPGQLRAASIRQAPESCPRRPIMAAGTATRTNAGANPRSIGPGQRSKPAAGPADRRRVRQAAVPEAAAPEPDDAVPLDDDAVEALPEALAPDGAADAEPAPSPDAPEAASPPDVLLSAAPDDAFPAGCLPLSRKSVTYQPVPFSWKAGAVSCLPKASFWHDGHTVSGASENFCSTSF